MCTAWRRCRLRLLLLREILVPKIEFRPRSRVKPESAYLLKFAKNVASQVGQDGIFEKMFEIIGINNRWCVEFGAWDGKHLRLF